MIRIEPSLEAPLVTSTLVHAKPVWTMNMARPTQSADLKNLFILLVRFYLNLHKIRPKIVNLYFISNKMSRNIFFSLTLFALLAFSATALQAQDQEEKTPEEMALEEADRLEEMLTLLPHQTFFIDSILQHDMRAMHDELQQLQMSGTREYVAFKQVRDKWVAQIDSAYKKVLTYDQWMQYCRSTGKLSKEEL